ncbi:sn-glycerol-3-phosphate import ATP-binding protein UgpC [Jeotgalicoccus saudimassiliensis]|uniref:sn-glycerol-3-phosphate import ATP-binding protein UgpC n=1 Tax=Jeotgalicoccus saudimassiliensis TaxID=1461582 RepID=A0A078M768_9STAP|nr:sn-glycerol-3-phosphate ABC transporter ATP-binding protein UgpC [Jeotgalicoccus saudimassiliensis]CEA02100.1 sn-glycerol-3-phosphate import ATP-binding protein UgpC [Jeotgalicoccus saudimassiliensis]
MARLHFKNIKKQYNHSDSNAVKDFSLDIKEGEFIVFVGPSGCGKSTILRMIAGLEDITDGEFYIGDTLMNSIPPKKRDIAMVFQNYALYPHMTVFDNIAFGLKMHKVSKHDIKIKVGRAAAILGLTDYLHRKPKALSGGQRQRVALGRAIVREANVFLMDEPLSNLDAKLRVQMRAEIMQLHQRLKTTTIYVTHDQTEAMTMASRIVIMNNGEIMQVGTPEAVYKTPANLFTAQFIGSPAMNIIDCNFDGIHLTAGSITITPTDAASHMLNTLGYKGKPVKLGIRPENVMLYDEDKHADGTPFKATVRISEMPGSEVIIYAELEGQSVTVKDGPENQSEPGDTITAAFDMSKAHLFNAETGERITDK